MAPHMCALTRLQDEEQTRSLLKYFEASRRTAVGGIDIVIRLLVKLRNFFEEECMARLCCVERGGALTHKHFLSGCKRQF